MTQTKKPDPLHGVTLADIVTALHEHYGWQQLGKKISIKCFSKNPSIQSSLKFLRRTPWARESRRFISVHLEKTRYLEEKA